MLSPTISRGMAALVMGTVVAIRMGRDRTLRPTQFERNPVVHAGNVFPVLHPEPSGRGEAVSRVCRFGEGFCATVQTVRSAADVDSARNEIRSNRP